MSSETSIYLAIDPDAVEMEKALDERGFPAGELLHGVVGQTVRDALVVGLLRHRHPGRRLQGTAEKGEAFLAAAVEECLGFVRDLLAKPLPERREPRETL